MNKVISIIVAIIISSATISAADVEIHREAQWANVTSVSVNAAENYMLLTMIEPDGSTRLFQSKKSNGNWTQPEPIATANANVGPATIIGGLFLTEDEHRLYFHANYANGVGGFDIYYMDKTSQGWSSPTLLCDINTNADEMSPTLTPGEQTIYLLRHQPVGDMKAEKKQQDRMSIYSASIDAEGKWKLAQPEDNILNNGYIQSVNVANDTKTLYYSMRKSKNEPAIIMHSQMQTARRWLQPKPIFIDGSDCDYLSLNVVGDKIYAVRSTDKKTHMGMIVSLKLPQQMRPLETIIEDGIVVTKGSHNPIKAQIIVTDPISSSVLGRYETDDVTGAYKITNLASNTYWVEVCSEGYSFDSRLLDYQKNKKAQMAKPIELFNVVSLTVNVLDNASNMPIKANMSAVRSADKKIFKPTQKADGCYQFSLPIGSNYNIIASSKNYDENKFLFKLDGQITFSNYERDIVLMPQQQEVTIQLVDAETKSSVNAEIIIENQSRGENITIKKAQMQNGTVTVKLRSNEKYNMIIHDAKGHSFVSRSIDTSQKITSLDINLMPLKVNASVKLNNVTFAPTTSILMPESRLELEQLVTLLKENPRMKIEIAAHTDNVGNAQRNQVLSESRATKVAAYLVESGIAAGRVKAKGYGQSHPIAPNDTEANRATNSRVEYKILSVE